MNISPPAPPAPAPPSGIADEPLPPPATTNTSTDVAYDGTEKVPDDVNDSETGTADVIEKVRELVFDAASTALKTKLNVVVDDVVLSVPLIITVPPSAAVFVIE